MEKIIKVFAYIVCVSTLICAVKKIAAAFVASVAAFKAVSVCKNM